MKKNKKKKEESIEENVKQKYPFADQPLVLNGNWECSFIKK